MSQLPIRKTNAGEQVDTRPMYIEEWLESLPYIDFKKTAALIEQALAATNKQELKPSVRLELMALYHGPYEYYLESQIKAGAQHTLQTIEAMQSQLGIMKQIAVHLSYGCKLAFDQSQMHKSLWKPSKPPYEAILMSMNYLSQALIFSYLEYSPVPKNVWKQLHFIYDIAASSQCDKKTFSIPGDEISKKGISFEHAYKRILMASLVDPHHLPFGAIWEIYEQLDSWVNLVSISEITSTSDSDGKFIINLDEDVKPVNYDKYDLTQNSKSIRLLDASPLLKEVNFQLQLLEHGKPLNESVDLSPFYARTLLTHMSNVWGLPPSRTHQRQTRKGQLSVYTGMEAIYYFINDKQAFIEPAINAGEEIDIADVDMERSDQTSSFTADDWRIVDESSGGYALIRDDKPNRLLKVGQLVLVFGDNQQQWQLAIVRWMMISRKVHKVGLEVIATKARAVAIKAVSGSKSDQSFRPALLMNYRDETENRSIMTEKGLFIDERELSLFVNNQEKPIKAKSLLESGVTCEVFKFA